MRKTLLVSAGLLCLVGLVSLGCSQTAAPVEPSFPELKLTPRDRVLILAPHPDDEVLACGGIIQKAVAAKVPLRVVFFTYGDGNEWSFLIYRKRPVVRTKSVKAMGQVRHDEALLAAKVLGLTPDQLTFLGYPDFRTQDLWTSHWGVRPPVKGFLTRATAVPYPNAFRPGAPYKGEEVLTDLETILRSFKPTRVFVSHPGDHNGDHRSLYLFTRVALWDLQDEMNPSVHPYLVRYPDWPKPHGRLLESGLTPPAQLATACDWVSESLTPDEVSLKDAALKMHRSQYQVSRGYLESFVRRNELFGQPPPVTFEAASTTGYLSQSASTIQPETVEQLTDQERAAFVGVVGRSVRMDGNALVITTTLSRPLGQAVGASVYVFGYRKDRPFARMPKLHVRFGVVGQEVFDQADVLSDGTVQITRSPHEMTLRIPLEALGNPDRVLTSTGTYTGKVPLDWTSWLTVELPVRVH